MQSSTTAGLKSWRCFKTVFGDATATKGLGRKQNEDEEEEGIEQRDEEEETVEEEQDEEEEEEEDGDGGRNDETPGEDVSLLANIPVGRRRIARRSQRSNSKLLLRESNRSGLCPSYIAGSSSLPPSLSKASSHSASREQRVDAVSVTAIARSSAQPPPDEWTDYTDGQWYLLPVTNEDDQSANRYSDSPRGYITRHLALAGRVPRVEPHIDHDLQTSFLPSESYQADDTSENLIDFETDEQTLIHRF